MRAFIYDKYGYYPPNEDSTSFEYKGWFFKLEISEKNDSQINELRLLLDKINTEFNPLGCDILLTRDNRYVSYSEYGPVIMVAIKMGEVNTDTLLKMHSLFFNKFNEKMKISKLRELWLSKSRNIEERILPSIPIDNKEFHKMKIIGEYTLYLIENAIQYLLDSQIYYGDEISNVTLTHKRIEKLDAFYLFNPSNLVVDSPMRDLSELYKNDEIIIEDLCSLIKKYNISSLDASLLMARCIYPSKFVDLFEDYYELKKDVKSLVTKYYDLIYVQLIKLKKLHAYLVKNYMIRPINWLK